MHDGPNRGQPTDRVQVGWDLAAREHVQAQAEVLDGSAADDGHGLGILATGRRGDVLSAGDDRRTRPRSGDRPRSRPGGADRDPGGHRAVRRADPALALSWRYALRSTLALLMADSSWKVTGFARSGWYLLERRPSES